MGNLVIKFVGICVHVNQTNFPELPSPHRVIFLANAKPLIDPRQPHLAATPHAPKLFLMVPAMIALDCVASNGAGDTFELHRVTLSVPNAKPPFVLDPTLESVPHLRDLGAGEADRGVILDGREPVAAYFDVEAGTLSACVNGGRDGAVITTLRMETSGAPKLRVKCMDGDGAKDLEFSEDSVVLSIANLAIDGKDNDADYLLNFKVCQSMPEHPKPPVTPEGLPKCGPQDPRITDDFNSACSNSNYP